MSEHTANRRFAILLPVKPPAVAKSRLFGLGDQLRRELVVAFAADTATAALESSAVTTVLAITDDFAVAQELRNLGAHVIPDGTSNDLNGSLDQAAAEAERRWPELWIAALCADLPSLRSDELTRALAAAPVDVASFVADSDGVGTTMLVAPSREQFIPRFGSGSRMAHLESGAVEIELADTATVRHDVDTPDDLAAASRMGLGARTSLITSKLRL